MPPTLNFGGAGGVEPGHDGSVGSSWASKPHEAWGPGARAARGQRLRAGGHGPAGGQGLAPGGRGGCGQGLGPGAGDRTDKRPTRENIRTQLGHNKKHVGHN